MFLSETLFHRWDFVKASLSVIEQGFLTAGQGLNILALHGTPLTADPVNIVYLGLEKLVTDLYPNVLAASIEGVPDHEAVLAKIECNKLADKYRTIRIIPVMYFAGMHAEKDLMGTENSWCTRLEEIGFTVDCPMIEQEGKEFYKGLAHYPQLISFFMDRIQRSLKLAEIY